jgi:hypothetical protein
MHSSAPGGMVRSNQPGPAPRKTSLMMQAQMNPVVATAAAAGVVLLSSLLLSRRR